jgi:hypothetical protein
MRFDLTTNMRLANSAMPIVLILASGRRVPCFAIESPGDESSYTFGFPDDEVDDELLGVLGPKDENAFKDESGDGYDWYGIMYTDDETRFFDCRWNGCEIKPRLSIDAGDSIILWNEAKLHAEDGTHAQYHVELKPIDGWAAGTLWHVWEIVDCIDEELIGKTLCIMYDMEYSARREWDGGFVSNTSDPNVPYHKYDINVDGCGTPMGGEVVLEMDGLWMPDGIEVTQ